MEPFKNSPQNKPRGVTVRKKDTPEPRPRKISSRRRREMEQQRQIVLATLITIGLVIVAIIGGVLYDQAWVPSRPVARVGDETLNRGEYWREQRNSYTQQIAQNFQLLALLGGNPQIASQFQGRSGQINQQAEQIRSQPVNDQVVGAWQDRELKALGARDLGVDVTDTEVEQTLASELGNLFLPLPDAVLTSTESLTATTSLTETAEAEAVPNEPTATAVLTPTLTPGGPTLTPEPTPTDAPTFTPEPTPEADVAVTQVGQIVDEIYQRYTLELGATDANAALSKDDFRAGLQAQYRDQLLNTKIEEQLVPETGFTASTDPTSVQARQILIAVETSADANQADVDQAFADERQRADDVVQQLRDGADFAELAATESDDPGSREQGGDLGSFDDKGVAENGATYSPELVQAAFGLSQNEISDPIRTQFGWHIIEVTNRTVPTEEDQLRTARTEALGAWLEEQRNKIEVRRFPEPTATPELAPDGTAPTDGETGDQLTQEPVYVPGPPTAAPTEELPADEPTFEPLPTEPEATAETSGTDEAATEQSTTGTTAEPDTESTASP